MWFSGFLFIFFCVFSPSFLFFFLKKETMNSFLFFARPALAGVQGDMSTHWCHTQSTGRAGGSTGPG